MRRVSLLLSVGAVIKDALCSLTKFQPFTPLYLADLASRLYRSRLASLLHRLYAFLAVPYRDFADSPLSHVDLSAISTDGGLKRLLKDRMAKHQWDDADEADFLKG